MRYPEGRILVFAKAPVPGQVKTRLQTQLSANQCAALQQRLIELTLQTAINSRLCPVELWCTDQQHPYFLNCKRNMPITLHNQHGDDLGQRMLNALSATLQTAKFAIIIGTDCVALTTQHLDAATTALNPANIPTTVITPAEDGGYVLIGANRMEPTLFKNITWGSAEVYRQTLRNIKQSTLQHIELDTLWDIDHPTDLRRAEQTGLLQW